MSMLFTYFCDIINLNKDDNTHSRREEMLKALVDAYKRYLAYRATYNELNSLTSRELYDLGIDRSQIALAAREATYGKGYSNA